MTTYRIVSTLVLLAALDSTVAHAAVREALAHQPDAQHEYLIRTPLKDLTAQLDAQTFWQIHRGTIVRASSIEAVNRDESGKLWLNLRGLPQKIAVSRLYAHLFKAM